MRVDGAGPGDVLALLPSYDVDPGRIGGIVQEVLGRPEFQQPEPGLIERIRRAVLEALADLLGGLLTGGTADLIGWGVALLAATALAVLTVRFLRGTSLRGGVSAGDRSEVHEPPDPSRWLREAEVHARAGRIRQAARSRYRALLAELELRGILEDRPGKTVGEETADLRRTRPAVAVPFADAAEVFQTAWYGPREPHPDDLHRLSGLCDRVLEVVR